ncbi:hypothetical protein ACLOJK_035277 [Asimina triloba]
MANDGQVAVDAEKAWASNVSSSSSNDPGMMPKSWTVPRNDLCIIPRVQDVLSRGSVHFYKPRTISIGPYYHGNGHLQTVQEIKQLYLMDLLRRNPSISEDDCMAEMRREEPRAQQCYHQDSKLPAEEFARMMLLDAAFIIEVFMKEWEDSHPPFFQSNPTRVKRDLLLLENQLPFFVLRHLFDLTIPQTNHPILPQLAINFFNSPLLKNRPPHLPPHMAHHHLLHLYQCQFCPDDSRDLITPETTYDHFTSDTVVLIPPATVLDLMGVELKKAPPESLLTEVKFSEVDDGNDHVKWVLEIPPLLIAEDTVARMFNLIAFEQSNFLVGTHITSHAAFLNSIVKKEEDVDFLWKKGIIEHRFSSHEEVIGHFAQMCSGAFVDPRNSALSAVLGCIKAYSESSEAIHRKTIWEARMAEKPWYYFFYKDKLSIALTLVAGVGGVGVWIFTCLQTL